MRDHDDDDDDDNDDDDDGITSSLVRLRFIAEWGTKAPGVLNG